MNYFLKFVLPLTFCLSATAEQLPLPEPYRWVQLLPVDEHNWFQQENRIHLKRLIEKCQPLIVVELGSWLGASAIYMAGLMKEDGKLYAVDNWIAQSDIALLSTYSSDIKKRFPRYTNNFYQM